MISFNTYFHISSKIIQFVDVGSRTIYDYFIKALQQTYDLQVRDGQNDYDFIDKELKEIFVTPTVTILIRKQREFQFKLLHGAIYTNEHLHRFGFVGDNLCSFCKQEIETYKHLFLSCGSVQRICQALIQLFELDEIKDLDGRDIFVGLVGSSYRIKMCNTIIFMVKYVTFMSRSGGGGEYQL